GTGSPNSSSRDKSSSGGGTAAHDARPRARPLDARPQDPTPSPHLAGGCRNHCAIQPNQVGPHRPGSLERLQLQNLRAAVPDSEGFDLLDAAEKPTGQVGRGDMGASPIA